MNDLLILVYVTIKWSNNTVTNFIDLVDILLYNDSIYFNVSMIGWHYMCVYDTSNVTLNCYWHQYIVILGLLV